MHTVVVTDLEIELAVVLDEMLATGAWAALDREAQLEWLKWVEDSGEVPRVRMYQAANRLLEGKTRAPRYSRAERVLDWVLSLPGW